MFKRIAAAALSVALLGTLAVGERTSSTAEAASSALRAQVQKVKVGSKTYSVQTVKIPKGTNVTVGLANRQVGQVDNFSSIVKTYKADAAINGAFFEAYGGPPDPYGNLIIEGRVAHVTRNGTTIGFMKDGRAIMDHLHMSISGTVAGKDGRKKSWYVTFLNRTPGENVNMSIMYTPDRGPRVGSKGGIAVVVRNGKVVKREVNNNISIPRDGYVIVYFGTEKSSADRFEVGAVVEKVIGYKDMNGKEIPWENVQTAVGAGPRLVKDSKVALNAAVEGFKDPKILTASGTRSGIAIMPDGSVMLATVSSATMSQWAGIMQKLGAKQAMNLDGGASSAMYGGGKTVTEAGRKLSNTLVFGTNVTK
ncbi:phosphodiester glycosidase family protein [Paenibacillaceae bacterium]|nr:phosphodiester glycosidase family protein [Paenibacillaceae bacterium]